MGMRESALREDKVAGSSPEPARTNLSCATRPVEPNYERFGLSSETSLNTSSSRDQLLLIGREQQAQVPAA